MKPFDKGFLVGASTAAHQVEGNNVHSDCWALERIPHTAYAEPSGEAVDHYRRYEEGKDDIPVGCCTGRPRSFRWTPLSSLPASPQKCAPMPW